jgi:hypothetical protein
MGFWYEHIPHLGRVERFLDAKGRNDYERRLSLARTVRSCHLRNHDAKLIECLPVVKAAIDARLQELQTDHGGISEERQAISDALVGLKVLRRELEARFTKQVRARLE